jgi:hypothetical protein
MAGSTVRKVEEVNRRWRKLLEVHLLRVMGMGFSLPPQF